MRPPYLISKNLKISIYQHFRLGENDMEKKLTQLTILFDTFIIGAHF